MFFHRIRRTDQNRLLGRPLDRWSPNNPFASNDVMIRNAIFLAVHHDWEVQLTTGEYLVMKEVPSMKKLVKDRPVRMVGSKDPIIPGCVLVPVSRQHARLPKVRNPLPDTFYRFNDRRNRVECMVTLMPNGLYVAWDTCGACSTHINACTCSAITPSGSVIHIWEVIAEEPFVKPTYKEEPIRNSSPSSFTRFPKPKLTKEAPKPKLVKDRPSPSSVKLDESTNLSDFETEAEKMAKTRTTALMKVLGAAKPRLTKG